MHKKEENKLKKWIKDNKVFAVIIAVIFVLVLFAFGAKIYLYIQLWLGNDTIITLDVDKRGIYLKHGQEGRISFEAKVKTNPFCTAVCNSKFIDVTKMGIIDKNEFTLKPGTPFRKEYAIKPTERGTGLDLYRFDMECRSISSVLCHTKEEPSTRSILITVEYNLSQEEQELKQILKIGLENLTKQAMLYNAQYLSLEKAFNDLNKTLILENPLISTKNKLISNDKSLEVLKEIWKEQDYYGLAGSTKEFKESLEDFGISFSEANNSLTTTINSYNQLINNIYEAKKDLEEIRNLSLTNITEINSVIDEFNGAAEILKQRLTLSEKEQLANNIFAKEGIISQIKSRAIREILDIELKTDINYESLCNITGKCILHPSINERANQPEFNINRACERISELNGILSEKNQSLKEEFLNQNYPASDDFWNDVKLKVINIKQAIVNEYLEKLPENNSNTNLIRELLVNNTYAEAADYSYNLTPALIYELASQKPDECNIPNTTIKKVADINLEPAEINRAIPEIPGIILEEPLPKCCVFGKCGNCCITEECRKDPSTFPVVFLHGHAVDRELSAEYSLEGFNKIQKRLEKDSYLNAGIITLYTAQDIPENMWSLINVPVTIKASYYFDVFKQPENYIVVQTKSENIDTYSIRLKELIDAIKYKTGKPKVNIIAFSMGSLVARRYVQIFGADSVEKLILIGAPNKGIAGDIASYCPIKGERLECKDMNADSLFINKLNSGKLDMPIYNIVGTGCPMGKESGDGIVLEKNALLDGADNYIINGTCRSKVHPLHLDLIDIDAYPLVYNIITDALKTNSQTPSRT